jgi:hypothetical protein
MCLKYCIAAATNPPKNNASRVDYYVSKRNQDNLCGGFDWTGVLFTASLKDDHRFESNNPGVAISWFNLDDENRKVRTFSVQCSVCRKFADEKTINLLFYKERWVVLNKSIDRLLNSGNKD